MKPTIGITCKDRNLGTQDYIDAVTKFGGNPILFASLEKPTAQHLESISEYLEQIDGLLLPGGGDMNPYVYFKKWDQNINKNISNSRDALEIRLCQAALEADIPIFGICRGIQVMNVAMKGNLYRDIKLFYPKKSLTHKKVDGEDSLQEIEIVCHSRLSEIVNENSSLVKSAHQQAVDVVGDGFVVTARTEDGIVEAMEIPSRRFVIGVQYHPERMLKKPELRGHAEKLFKAFIDAAFSIRPNLQ